ncbi:MAG: hypothetical protein JOZ54_10000 [Acidobacteria bacterium]|nr:hypothetical protein [Acidobacteriota bacterium]
MQHLDDSDFITYLLKADSEAVFEDKRRHLRNCVECQKALADVEDFNRHLRDAVMWRAADDLSNADSLRQSLSEWAARLAEEDAKASALLGLILRSPGEFIWADVGNKYRGDAQAGVVRILCQTAREFFERDPLHARTLAEHATLVAEAIADDVYPAVITAELRGMAWKECANAFRYLGLFDAANDALNRAERAYRRLPDSSLPLAITGFIRASVFYKSERFEEAAALASTAATEFSRLRQTTRYSHARALEASAFARMGRPAAARDVTLPLLAAAEAENDLPLRARLSANLASYHIELGELQQAGVLLHAALQLYGELDIVTEANRARWLLGRLELRSGRFDTALPQLRRSIDECVARGMLTDAALVLLDVCEALIIAGRRTQEITTHCRDLAARFKAAGMLTSALTALAFLREAASLRQLTPSVVTHVRTFFERLEEHPQLLFVPPVEPRR